MAKLTLIVMTRSRQNRHTLHGLKLAGVAKLEKNKGLWNVIVKKITNLLYTVKILTRLDAVALSKEIVPPLESYIKFNSFSEQIGWTCKPGKFATTFPNSVWDWNSTAVLLMN